MGTRPLHVHIGAGKTGTSSLQAAFRSSLDVLAAQGWGMPLLGRGVSVRRALRPLGWVMGAGFVEPPSAERLGAFVTSLRETPGERLLLSNEDLSEMDGPRIRLFLDAACAAGMDVRVVLTARDWSKQLPSEYQQFLKHRLTLDYPTFLEDVRDNRGPAARRFRWRQDFAAICRRWSEHLPPSRISVLSVPSPIVQPDGVFRLFGEAVGFDGTMLRGTDRMVNTAFGYTEAEVLRRVNVALGERLPDYERDYTPVVRKVLAREVLARGGSAPLTLPPEHLGWVRREDQARIEELRGSGCRLVGDPATLVAQEDAARPLPALDEAEIAQAAIRTLTDFTVRATRLLRSTEERHEERS